MSEVTNIHSVNPFSKYIASFDYFYKTLIILSATSDGISIILLASIIGAPV